MTTTSVLKVKQPSTALVYFVIISSAFHFFKGLQKWLAIFNHQIKALCWNSFFGVMQVICCE